MRAGLPDGTATVTDLRQVVVARRDSSCVAAQKRHHSPLTRGASGCRAASSPACSVAQEGAQGGDGVVVLAAPDRPRAAPAAG